MLRSAGFKQGQPIHGPPSRQHCPETELSYKSLTYAGVVIIYRIIYSNVFKGVINFTGNIL